MIPNSIVVAPQNNSAHDVSFYKMEGCGNNFIVLADPPNMEIEWQLKTKKLLDKNYGIGGDGLMIVSPSTTHDFHVTMFNPDGSSMGMCGNGIRCVTRFVVMQGLVSPGKRIVRFDVEGRSIVCTFVEDGRFVSVDMGHTSFNPKSIPLNSRKEMIQSALMIDGNEYEVSCVSVGNPHCVVLVSDVERVPLQHIGPLIEKNEMFPQRTNVEFVEVISRNQLKVRVWERGAGATLACGTGACASLVVAAKTGRCNDSAEVVLPGGTVQVEWNSQESRVFLKGPAHEIFRGYFDPHQF